ncbi:hypothetical protein [Burkholderia cepacia]|uniref:hypothetical protein n=1 Tax=Burkholderia cepacia TaxID=292 RepID=UPI001FC899A6|nr:hypothetical protein [Burkholderia cepacia]
MTLDIEKLRAENPLIDGAGMIPIVEAARTVGMQPESLANELLNDGAHVFTHLHGQSCWRVPVLNDLDRDFGGEFIWNEVKANGERAVHTGTVRVLDGRATLQQAITAGAAQEGVFRDGKSVGIFLEDPIAVDLARCIVHKTAVTKVRARLVASLSPASKVALSAPSIISGTPTALPVPSPSATVGAVPTGLPTRIEPTAVVFDPITAKHGKKRFWGLFELYARSRTWGEDQTRRMTTEAGLFRDLMGDPELGEIELETIDQYASRLAQLTACMTMGSKFDIRDADQFVPGVTTMQQAQEKLGTPTATNAMPNGGTLQQWMYSQASVIGGTSSNLAILFDKDGKMIRIQSRGQVNTR